jgi:hypothetical protein
LEHNLSNPHGLQVLDEHAARKPMQQKAAKEARGQQHLLHNVLQQQRRHTDQAALQGIF